MSVLVRCFQSAASAVPPPRCQSSCSSVAHSLVRASTSSRAFGQHLFATSGSFVEELALRAGFPAVPVHRCHQLAQRVRAVGPGLEQLPLFAFTQPGREDRPLAPVGFGGPDGVVQFARRRRLRPAAADLAEPSSDGRRVPASGSHRGLVRRSEQLALASLRHRLVQEPVGREHRDVVADESAAGELFVVGRVPRIRAGCPVSRFCHGALFPEPLSSDRSSSSWFPGWCSVVSSAWLAAVCSGPARWTRTCSRCRGLPGCRRRRL